MHDCSGSKDGSGRVIWEPELMLEQNYVINVSNEENRLVQRFGRNILLLLFIYFNTFLDATTEQIEFNEILHFNQSMDRAGARVTRRG